MEMGESRDTAVSNQEIGFTCEGKCLLPLRLVVMFWDGSRPSMSRRKEH